MSDDNLGNSAGATGAQPAGCGGLARRLAAADRVPFVLRAWWLREFAEYADCQWLIDQSITGPLWSSYTDPLCDMGSLDYFYE